MRSLISPHGYLVSGSELLLVSFEAFITVSRARGDRRLWRDMAMNLFDLGDRCADRVQSERQCVEGFTTRFCSTTLRRRPSRKPDADWIQTALVKERSQTNTTWAF